MRFAPVLTLWHRTRVERNDLRGQLLERDERIDRLKSDLAVERRRSSTWRELAMEAGVGHPAAMEKMLWQAQREELADADEIADEQRNAFPRSLP